MTDPIVRQNNGFNATEAARARKDLDYARRNLPTAATPAVKRALTSTDTRLQRIEAASKTVLDRTDPKKK